MFYFTLLTCLIVVTSSDGTLIVSSQNTSEMKPGFVGADKAGNVVAAAANFDSIPEGSEVNSVDSDTRSPYVNTQMSLTKRGDFEQQSLYTEKDIDALDKYVDLVTSMIPIRFLNILGDVDPVSVVDGFNSQLEKSQNHVSMWRYGDNIKSSIKRTYESAKLFGPEFQRKYDRFQKLKMWRNSNPDLKKKDDLLKDIEEIKGILQNSPSEDIVSFMEEQLLKKEKGVKKLSAVERDLDEIIIFSEFVKKDADIIKERANVTKKIFKIFKDFILTDQSSYIQSKTNVKQAIDASSTQLNNILDQIEEYEKNKVTEEEIREHLAEEITKAKAQIEDRLQEQKENIMFANKAKPITTIFDYIFDLFYIRYVISFFRNFLQYYSETTRPTVEVPPTYSERPRLNLEQLDESVSINLKEADLTQKKIDQITQKIYDLKDKTLKMETYIENLSFVKHLLETMIEETERILPYISKFLENLNLLVNISDKIILRLENLSTKPREVKGPIEKEQFENLFYIDMSTIQTDWNAYLNITCMES